MESAWSSLLEGLESGRLCRVLPILLNEVELHQTLAAVMSLVKPNDLIEILSRVPPGHLRAVCKASPESMVQLLSHTEPEKVREMVIPMLLEPQNVIDGSLVPVLAKVQDPTRLAKIINLVDKEVLLHLLRHVDGEHLATLVNAFENDKDFEAEGAVIRLLQEASKDYKLLQEKVAPLMRDVAANKTARVVCGVQPPKLLAVLRQVDCNSVLTLMASANEDLVVQILAGPLDSIATKTAPGVAEVMNELSAFMSVMVEGADQVFEVVKSRTSSEIEAVSNQVRVAA